MLEICLMVSISLTKSLPSIPLCCEPPHAASSFHIAPI
jgi:hypothetical protein